MRDYYRNERCECKAVSMDIRGSILLYAMFFILMAGVYFLHASVPAGTGDITDPYQIATLDNLLWISDNPAEWDKYYEQTADIDASDTENWNNGEGWEPIGNNAARFTGSYDGQKNRIMNLTINRPGADNQGLFGHVGNDLDSTTIKNLGLVNANIIGARGVGTLIGRVTGNSQTIIEYCSSVGGSVVGDGATGGLIGSHNSFRETPGGEDNPLLLRSFADVTVTSSGSGNGDKYGGLVGCTQKGTITDCYARGNVTVTNIIGERIAGLAGCADFRGEINNSYSTGEVDAPTSSSVGGLVGSLSGQGQNVGIVNNSYWDTETSDQGASAGGEGRTTTEMTYEYAANTFVGWDFDDVWYEDNDYTKNDGYPGLQEVTSSIADWFVF